MQSNNSEYSPRPGSKISAAIQALLDGPMPTDALANAMRSPSNSISQMLKAPMEHGLIVKVQDNTGLLHYACAGMSLDDKFMPYAGRAGTMSPETVVPPRAAVNPADPFGLVAKQATQRPAARKSRSAPATSTPQAHRAANVKPLPPAAVPSNEEVPFVAALFSTGDLMIKVGEDTVMLSRSHQVQLRQYVARFEE
ncbi:MAG: hypothetical protein WA191_05230 [Telluria sp.]